jgi:hypothetical protein
VIPSHFHAILLRLELLSHGATASIDANRVHGSKERPSQPAGESRPPHLEYRRRYENAHTERGRREVVDEAQECLDEWTHKKPPEHPEYGSYHWKLAIANSNKTGAELARFHGISRQTVQIYRRKFRQDAA